MASGAEEARAGANGIRVPLVDAAADEVQRRPYDKEAAMLFNNMRLPAAIIAGSILPLGFGFPLPMQGVSSGVQQACARAHMLLAVISLGAELVAIVYATVAVNKLTETTAVPATSVMMLLASEYEAWWLGCNVMFLIGLYGAAAMIALRAALAFGVSFGLVPVLVMSSCALLMTAIVNEGIAKGDGRLGDEGAGSGTFRFGKHFGGIFLRYVRLLIARVAQRSAVCLGAALTCALAALILGIFRVGRDDLQWW